MLSTDRLDAPHISNRRTLGLEGVTVVSWRMISISVWVLPVPVTYRIRGSLFELPDITNLTGGTMYASYFWRFKSKFDGIFLTRIQSMVKECETF